MCTKGSTRDEHTNSLYNGKFSAPKALTHVRLHNPNRVCVFVYIYITIIIYKETIHLKESKERLEGEHQASKKPVCTVKVNGPKE